MAGFQKASQIFRHTFQRRMSQPLTLRATDSYRAKACREKNSSAYLMAPYPQLQDLTAKVAALEFESIDRRGNSASQMP